MKCKLFFRRLFCGHIWATQKKKELRRYTFLVNNLPFAATHECTVYVVKQKCLKCAKVRLLEEEKQDV